MASRDNNQKLKDKLAKAYGVTSEQIACKGCSSKERFIYCQACDIRSCAMVKKIEGCHQYEEFPCQLIENFPVPVVNALENIIETEISALEAHRQVAPEYYK